MRSDDYSKEYYETIRAGSIRSVEVIVPLVLELLQVQSVVDVRCGEGAATFRKSGVADVLGVDGEYTSDAACSFRRKISKRSTCRAVCAPSHVRPAVLLEVAEHLPSECAAPFVESFTRLAPAVLFPAAIPCQGGNHHINEQWPDKWAELFKKRDYVTIDCHRKQVWQNETVEWYYAQNMLLFVRADRVASDPASQVEFERTNLSQLMLVHPRQFLHLQGLYSTAVERGERPGQSSGLREASRLFLICLKNSIGSKQRLVWSRETSPISERNSSKPKT